MKVSGTLRKGGRTKQLVSRLQAGDVAVIDHPDLDELAARALVQRQIGAVLNTSDSWTGRYPAGGTGVLLEADVPHVDRIGQTVADALPEGERVDVISESPATAGPVRIRSGDCEFRSGRCWCRRLYRRYRRLSQRNLEQATRRFATNTLQRGLAEMDRLLGDIPLPPLRTSLAGRPCLVVVRGPGFRQDLTILRTFVREANPVKIGVDGGADALLERGWRPDIVVGDMDSVSDGALRQVPERVVHAYPDGSAPGMARLQKLELEAVPFPVGGTSEDAALLLAYEAGAEVIAAVGTHTHVVDFLDKGRQGMASTLLVRLKVGPRLIDAKGVHRLHRSPLQRRQLLELAAAGLIPVGLLVATSPMLRNLLRLLLLNLRVSLGW